MPASLWFFPLRAATWCLCLALCAGCGKSDRLGYVPDSDSAQQALEAVLTAWQAGKPAQRLETAAGPVQPIDSGWLQGHRLESYEILGDETDSDSLRWFSVRLNLENADSTLTARYVVLGRDTFWVYREEDYKRSRSWEGYQTK